MLTGASGFFGANLVELLADADDELHLLTRSQPEPAAETMGPTGPTVHRVDLFDRDGVQAVLEAVRPSHLCHLAWLGPEHEDRYRSPENARWVEASRSLFEAFVETGGRRLVQVGSCIEYGNAHSGVRTESDPLAPDTAYGEAKAELSAVVEALGDRLSTAIARPFFCYGPHEQPERLVPSIILALDRGEPIDLTEGRQIRDYLDVRDVAGALATLLRTEDATGPFNIGAGEGVPVRAIAERLGEVAGRPDLLRFGARPEGADSAAEIVADIGRITAATSWRPTTSLERGLEQTAAWWLHGAGSRR